MEHTVFDLDFLTSNREAFNALVYTPLSEVQAEIERRSADFSLLPNIDFPPLSGSRPVALLYVSMATPNFLTAKFMEMVRDLGYQILICAQLKDVFSTRNQWKHFLGKMSFFMNVGRKGGFQYKRKTIIDFNSAQQQSLGTLTTLWGEPLVDVHHRLLFKAFPELQLSNLFDFSGWLKNNGPTPKEYYKALLSLAIRGTVLFENYYLNEDEKDFTRSVFLPAFIHVYKKYGHKPLIVPIEPFGQEGNQYWYSHSSACLHHVKPKE